jgi:ERCC4-type nuclease
MHILIDTREQLPYAFEGRDCTTERQTLPVGDYSLAGFTDKVSIERKSLDDLIGCFMGENRERFEKELAKLRYYECAHVIVEGSYADIQSGSYASKMLPKAALETISAFIIRYRVGFIMCDDRAGGERMTYSLLSKFCYEIGERYKLLKKNQVDK